MFQFQLADEARGAFMRVPLIDFRPGAGASFVIVYNRESGRVAEWESGRAGESARESGRDRESEVKWPMQLIEVQIVLGH